jgi:hypothetical protein
VFIHTKVALSAFMVLFATSAAMANDLETSPAGTQSAPKWSDYPDHMQTRGSPVASNSTCPWLEGYPDCHPDTLHQPDIEPARQHPITDPWRHQRTPKYRRQSAAPASRSYGPARTTERKPAQA